MPNLRAPLWLELFETQMIPNLCSNFRDFIRRFFQAPKPPRENTFTLLSRVIKKYHAAPSRKAFSINSSYDILFLIVNVGSKVPNTFPTHVGTSLDLSRPTDTTHQVTLELLLDGLVGLREAQTIFHKKSFITYIFIENDYFDLI